MADETEAAEPKGFPWTLVVAGLILAAALVGAPLAMFAGLSSLRSFEEEVEQALWKAERLEVLSLDGEKPLPPTEGFHGFRILRKLEVVDPAEREAVAREFLYGVHENTGMSAPCFKPKFGLRVQSGGRSFDLVVSFECLLVNVYEGAKSAGSLRVSVTPQPYFYELFKAAEAPAAKN